MERPLIKFIDELKEKLGRERGEDISDNKLSVMLNRSSSTIHFIRKGTTRVPTYETLESLAKLSGERIEKVLFLALESDEKATPTILKAFKNIEKAAVKGGLFIGGAALLLITLLSAPSYAADSVTTMPDFGYYVKLSRLWRRLKDRFFIYIPLCELS